MGASGGVRVIKLGAGVSPASLRTVLTWIYSGRLDVQCVPRWHDSGAPAATSLAALARSCGLPELAALVRRCRPRAGATVSTRSTLNPEP